MSERGDVKGWLERRTGILFGTYLPQIKDETMRDTWLVIAPARGDRMFSVILGSKGFYVTRAKEPDA